MFMTALNLALMTAAPSIAISMEEFHLQRLLAVGDLVASTWQQEKNSIKGNQTICEDLEGSETAGIDLYQACHVRATYCCL